MPIKQYRKKPIVIEAIQYQGFNMGEVSAFVGLALVPQLESETAYEAKQGPPIFSLVIPTLEGDMKAMPTDYIIKGIKGEFYPIKADIFEGSYEIVN